MSHMQSLHTTEQPASQMALLPLLSAIAICLVISIYPRILVDSNGHADHTVASILFWAMSAGFIRGVGYIPTFWLFRYLLSQYACYVACLLTVYLMFFK